MTALRYALIGDGDSPHLAKWVRALAPRTELWVASSRGFAAEIEALVPATRRLALHGPSAVQGGNIGLLKGLPALARWLRRADADWLNPHYLTSHGLMAALAQRGWALAGPQRLRARLLASAWGSDILVTPERHAAYRWLMRRVLGACDLGTSDSSHMARRMRELGAREVMVFPFGLDELPPPPPPKQPWLFFANRGLEPLYRPERVLACFARIAAEQPAARLVVANDGSLRPALERSVQAQGLAARIEFVGRLDAATQAGHYARAQWYLSQPASDAVSVSVLEALAHGCLPLLSDLPANRELVVHGEGGLLLAGGELPALAALEALRERAPQIAAANRAWVAQHALFPPAIERLLARLEQFGPTR
ncbi:MAG TPA: glycosyltransferase [Ideonella sp.]|nr:glycosyltransferase [Ideonella sp.]